MRAFVLAGGFATRLWPLTEKRAKPLLPIAGKPIVSHLIEKIPKGMPVTVSTNSAFQDGFREWMKNLGRDAELIVEGAAHDGEKRGALGAIATWVEQEKIDDDLLVLTGDNYLGFSVEEFIARFTGAPLVAAHDIGDLDRARAFGVVVLESPGSTRVKAFVEKPAHPESSLVSTGCVILPKAYLKVVLECAKIKPDNLGGIFEEFLAQKIPVECFTFSDRWMDIGSFHSYLEAHRDLVGEALIAHSTAKMHETMTSGSVTVGKGCVIERSDIKDCIIFDNVTIRDCTLRNCMIDDGCVLEGVDLKDKMLRAGTKLSV